MYLAGILSAPPLPGKIVFGWLTNPWIAILYTNASGRSDVSKIIARVDSEFNFSKYCYDL